MTKNFTEEFVSINGISQYFLHIPNESKDVIIMLHGGPGVPNSYAAYYHQPYVDFCNVVYYDQRGAGKTQIKNKSKPESLSLDIMIEDLRQTIVYVKEKYATERVFLVGHSCGADLGTQYIIKHPHDVAGYIGFGQMVDASRSDKSWFEHLKAAVEKAGNKKHAKKINAVNDNYPNIPVDEYVKATAALADLEFNYGFKVNDFVEIYKKSPVMTLKDGMLMMQVTRGGAMNQKLTGDVFYRVNISDVKEYHVPVYYILGRHDEWTTSAITAEYFETIQAPKKGLHWIENAGHFMDTDNPSAFFGAVKETLAQV